MQLGSYKEARTKRIRLLTPALSSVKFVFASTALIRSATTFSCSRERRIARKGRIILWDVFPG